MGTEGTEGKGEKPQTSEKPSRKIISPGDKTEVHVSSLWPHVPTQRLVLAGKTHVSAMFSCV